MVKVEEVEKEELSSDEMPELENADEEAGEESPEKTGKYVFLSMDHLKSIKFYNFI